MVHEKRTYIEYDSIEHSEKLAAVFFGVLLYSLMFGGFLALNAVVGAIAFVIVYSGNYLYNDIVDISKDRNDPKKLKLKVIAQGYLKVGTARKLMLLCFVSGLAMSSLVNIYFFLANVAMVFLNYLHSSPRINMRKSHAKTLLNMFALQMLKFTSGWLAIGQNIERMPVFLLLMVSMVYTNSYLFYKLGMNLCMIRKNYIVLGGMGLLSAILFALSFAMYPFRTEMITLIVLMSFYVLLAKKMRMNPGNMTIYGNISWAMLIISFSVAYVRIL